MGKLTLDSERKYIDPIAVDEQNHIALCCWGIMATVLIVQLRGLLSTALCWLYAHVSLFGISVPSFQRRGLSRLHFRRVSSCQWLAVAFLCCW